MGNPQINIYCLCNPHQPPCCGSEPPQHRTMRINTKHCVYRYASFLHGQPPRRMKRRRMLIPLGGYTYTILFTIIMSLCCTGSLSRLCPRGVQYNPVDMVSLQLPISKPAMLVSIQTVNNLSIPAYLLLSLHQTFYLLLKSPRGGFHPDILWPARLTLFFLSYRLTLFLSFLLPLGPHPTPLLFFAYSLLHFSSAILEIISDIQGQVDQLIN
jgi:hypothetical protein